MYKVVRDFTDKDNKCIYRAGDIFPRLGTEVTQERINELATENNKRKEILIQKEPESEVLTPVKKKRKRRNARTDLEVN